MNPIQIVRGVCLAGSALALGHAIASTIAGELVMAAIATNSAVLLGLIGLLTILSGSPRPVDYDHEFTRGGYDE